MFLYQPYPKQKDFHALGKTVKERGLFAANQTGKTNCAANEVAFHLTGLYPEWWDGWRQNSPGIWWVGSETAELTRDGAQRKLMGAKTGDKWLQGALPASLILDYKMARGTPDAVETVKVRHVSGVSEIVFKAFADGREKWQAGTVHGVWLDEEPEEEIYTEAYTRTVAHEGPVLCTFTPLKGMSTVVLRFPAPWNPNIQHPDRAIVNMTLDDVPAWPVGHFTDDARRKIISAYPAHEVEARTRGYPMLGSGRIFPIPEDSVIVDDFPIPEHWKKIGGLDFGWDHPTAAVVLAIDPEDCIYVCKEYRQSRETPLYHAAALKPWGVLPWAWPHDALQHDKGSGDQLKDTYSKHGLKMLSERAQFPDDRGNGVEAGIAEMLERMQTARWKVFRSCVSWLEEFRSYHRKDGRIVKEREDLISASRYAYMMRRHAQAVKDVEPPPDRYRRLRRWTGRTWMSA